MSEKTLRDHITHERTTPKQEVLKQEWKIIKQMHNRPQQRVNKPSGSSGSTRNLTKLPGSTKMVATNKICRLKKSNSVEVLRKTNTVAQRTVSNLRTRPKMTQNVTVVSINDPNIETAPSRRHSPSPTSPDTSSNLSRYISDDTTIVGAISSPPAGVPHIVNQVTVLENVDEQSMQNVNEPGVLHNTTSEADGAFWTATQYSYEASVTYPDTTVSTPDVQQHIADSNDVSEILDTTFTQTTETKLTNLTTENVNFISLETASVSVIGGQIINGQLEFVETELDVEQVEAGMELEREVTTRTESQEASFIEDQIINRQLEFVETELDVEQAETMIELEHEANTRTERQQAPAMECLSSEVEVLAQVFGSYNFFCEETNNFADECRSNLHQEITNIQDKCQEWNGVLELDRDNIPEDIVSEIEAVNGKAALLITGKLRQFQDLVDRFEQKCSGAPMMEDDLRGFWDLTMIEVRDIFKGFDYLRSLKENDWMEEKPDQKVVQSKNQLTKYKVESKIKLAIRAAKEENKNKMITDDKIALFNQIFFPTSSNVVDVQKENNTHCTPDVNGPRRSQRLKEKEMSEQKSRDIFGEVQNRPFDTPRTTQTTSAKEGKSESKKSTKKSLAVDLVSTTPSPRRSVRLQYTPHKSGRNCVVCPHNNNNDI